ncbi:MAG: DUF4350 domain-containing protein, partial [Candidatus Thorarchaeota archaeon]
KDSIVEKVMDYWLGGGGILSFDSGLGFLYYHGMIVPGETGNYGLLDVDVTEHWGFRPVTNVEVGARHSAAKDYYLADVIPVGENTTVHDVDHFAAANSADFNPLLLAAIWSPALDSTVGFALDNSERQGGRIVQLPGNCSDIPSWETSIIIDSVDWLAPRPKGRILVDLTHDPLITVDSWDEGGSAEYADWRDAMVSHGYTVDKLHPSPTGNLTEDNLNGYDMLFIPMPRVNFTSSEVADVTSWVSAGGGLFCLGDRWVGTLADYDQNLNYLLMNFDVSIFETGDTGDPIGFYDEHPTTEDCTIFYDNIYGLVNFTGDASGVWRTDDVNYISAVDTYGSGRIILVADINWIAETYLGDNSHYQYAINVANWLTAATANVLLYNDEFIDPDTYGVAPALALRSLGIKFYLTTDEYYFNVSLYENWDQWDMVVFDQPGDISNEYLDDIQGYVESGRKFISSLYWAAGFDDHPIWPMLGCVPTVSVGDQPDVHIWESDHPVFNLPVDYNAGMFDPIGDYGGEGAFLHVLPNGIPLAGLTASPEENESVIVLRDDGKVLTNSFLIDEFNGDYDNSTYMDSFELWVNEIGFIYYDRPMIDHPADVTYMQTETGNEIVWTPTADAGPWEYAFYVNGTPVEGGRWFGGPLAFNIDGVNVSITEYELEVFDRLGYGVSDLVILNVTEYIAPPGPGPIDTTLLLIIGAAVVGVIIILVVVMKKKK